MTKGNEKATGTGDRMDPEGERFGDHPTPEELSAYQAGELSPERFDQVQEHLVGCPLCTEVLLDLERFLDLPPEDRPRQGVADLETEAGWRALRSKLDDQGLLPGRRTRKPGRSLIAAIAAVFLVAIGFAFYVLLQGPERLQTLEAEGTSRGRSRTMETVVQPPTTLALKVSAQSPYSEYRADIRRGDRVLRRYSHLKRTPFFDVRIPLARGDWEPGSYQIQLQGISHGIPAEIETYSFKVVQP